MEVATAPERNQTELGVIAFGWTAQRISELAECFSGGTPNTSVREYYGGAIPWITSGDLNAVRIRDVEGRITKLGLANSSAKMVEAGDLLIALYGATAGVAARTQIPAAINQAILAIKPSKILNTEFLFQYLRFQKQAYLDTYLQGGQPNLSGEIVKSFLIPVPALCEQEAIAEVLSNADAYIESMEKLLAKKRAIMQGAMQELLTGTRRLPGFEKMPGWKSTEVGSIPRDWIVVEAKQLGNFRGGTGFPLSYQGATSGAYPFFKVSDMNNDGNETFMRTSNNYISETQRKLLGAPTFAPGTIVLAKVGAAVFLERKRILSQTSCLDNNMAGFTLFDGSADHRFVHFLFRNTRFGDLVSTTALPALNGSVLSAMKLIVPSDLQEQSAISSALSDMDDEVAAINDHLAKACNIKQGMMQQLLTGKVRLV